jgi:PTH1 family peptidyl-tRNA hydrolase
VYLVVGLGNPGIEYQFTPHNAGFLAIDRIAEQSGVAVANRRCRAQTARITLAGKDVVLAKPETFMNLSGISVAALVSEFGVDPGTELIVLYDELALPLGAVRVTGSGSAGGHNGARSIIGSLGTQQWQRVRIGVGPEPSMGPALSAHRRGTSYLLGPMKKSELLTLDEALDRAAGAVEAIVTEGIGAAMNKFNGWNGLNRRERNSPAE